MFRGSWQGHAKDFPNGVPLDEEPSAKREIELTSAVDEAVGSLLDALGPDAHVSISVDGHAASNAAHVGIAIAQVPAPPSAEEVERQADEAGKAHEDRLAADRKAAREEDRKAGGGVAENGEKRYKADGGPEQEPPKD